MVLGDTQEATLSLRAHRGENCIRLIERTCESALIFPISKVIIKAVSGARRCNLVIARSPPIGARLPVPSEVAPAYPNSAGSNNGNTPRVPRRAATVVCESTDFSRNKDAQNIVNRVRKERDPPRSGLQNSAPQDAIVMVSTNYCSSTSLSLSHTHTCTHMHTHG